MINRLLHSAVLLRDKGMAFRFRGAWRYANRHDLPTLTEWIILALAMLIIVSAGYAYDSYRMDIETQEAIEHE